MPSAAVSIRNTTTLDDIARTIRSEWERGRVAVTDALEARLNVGCALRDARARFSGDREFGEWFREQGFPFARKAAWEMRRFAEHEPKIRAEILEMRAGGEGMSFSALMRELFPPTGSDVPRLEARGPVVEDEPEVPPGYLACQCGALFPSPQSWANHQMEMQSLHRFTHAFPLTREERVTALVAGIRNEWAMCDPVEQIDHASICAYIRRGEVPMDEWVEAFGHLREMPMK